MQPQPFQLPDELIIHIFHIILKTSKTLEAYETLRNCALVCKWWAPIAGEVLLTWAELPSLNTVYLLTERLKQLVGAAPGKSFIKTLAYGARPGEGYLALDPLLALDPGVHHLILCESSSHSPFSSMPKNLSRLHSLTDITFLSSISPGLSAGVLGPFLRALPPTVRFINIPQDTPYIRWSSDFSPAPSLYGLAIPSYPSKVTEGILRRSRDSLQCLTVSLNLDPIALGERHPNIRSLKILDPFPAAHSNFSSLKSLERLEIRWFIRTQGLLDWVLPDSLQYIRLWGKQCVEDLMELLADSERLPNLRVVVWDWWFPDALEERHGMKVMEKLRELCVQRNIDLRTYQRKTHPSEASVGKDFAYENALRQSCFDVGTPLSHPPISKLPTRIARSQGKLHANFASSAAKHPRLVEECFDDYE